MTKLGFPDTLLTLRPLEDDLRDLPFDADLRRDALRLDFLLPPNIFYNITQDIPNAYGASAPTATRGGAPGPPNERSE